MKNVSIRLPVRLPEQLKKELDQSVLLENYGFKGRSKWVTEAIDSLINHKEFPDLVALDDTIEVELQQNVFSISEETRDKLENALIKTRVLFPERKITLSSIIRTAILQRILREAILPLEKEEAIIN